MNNETNVRVPPPHGNGSGDLSSVAQSTPESPPQSAQMEDLTAQSLPSSYPLSIPSQEPILPQDRSTLSQDNERSRIFLENQRSLTENLVYAPVNPINLPPTQKLKRPLPKTPKPKPNLNYPPEEETTMTPYDVREDQENMALQKHWRNRVPISKSVDEAFDSNRVRDTATIAEEASIGAPVISPAAVSTLTKSMTLPSNTTVAEHSNTFGDCSKNTSFAAHPSTSSATGPSQESSSFEEPIASTSALPSAAKALDLKQPHNYEELDVIGNGAYGTVYRGRDLSDSGKFVALKKIRVSLTDDGVPVSAVREISLLKSLDKFRHPNIVRLLDICHGSLESERRLNLVLVFEYVEMDLDTYLKKVPSPGLCQAKIKNLMHQMMSGVDFLHQNRIIHRDLKPQNLLVDRYDRLKIADFGLARMYDFNMRVTTTVVTLWYRAPEILLSDSYSSPVDIWSCACIFAELFRNRPLFEGRTEGEQLQRIFEVIGTPAEGEWPTNVSLCVSQFRGNYPRRIPDVVPEICDEAADLMQKMLKFVPDNRASASQSLRHSYFNSIRAESNPTSTMQTFARLAASVEPKKLPVDSDIKSASYEASPAAALSHSPPKGNDENNPNSSNVSSNTSSAPAINKYEQSSAVMALTPPVTSDGGIGTPSSGRNSSTESENL